MQNIYNNLVSNKVPEPPKDMHSPQVHSRNLPSVKPDNYGSARQMNPNRISHVKSAGILSVNRNLVGRPSGSNYPGKAGANGYSNNSPLRPKKGGKAGAGGDYGNNGV